MLVTVFTSSAPSELFKNDILVKTLFAFISIVNKDSINLIPSDTGAQERPEEDGR